MTDVPSMRLSNKVLKFLTKEGHREIAELTKCSKSISYCSVFSVYSLLSLWLIGLFKQPLISPLFPLSLLSHSPLHTFSPLHFLTFSSLLLFFCSKFYYVVWYLLIHSFTAYVSFICRLLNAHTPIIKYNIVRITRVLISGSVFTGV